ncbi:hypothetical protein A5733_25285 [Mycobacterium sp. NS-7484]|nr:hypothetical protein A5733_25285 [Mycobacterium sp. NS-7484]
MTRRSLDVSLLAVAALWGSSYLATKEVVGPASVFPILVLRFAFATAVLAGVLARRLSGLTSAEMVAGVVGGTLLTAVCAAETYGVTMTSASNAGLIMALTIVATPVLQRSPVGRRFYLAATLAVIGCTLLTQSGGFTAARLGDLVIVIAALLRAIHVITLARLSERAGTDAARTTLIQLLTVAVVSTMLCAATGQSMWTTATGLDMAQWSLVGYLALGCTVFAFLVQLRALRVTSPARVSLLLGTEPMWAVLLGIVMGGDPVTGTGIAGAVLVIAGTGWGRQVLTLAHDGSRGVARSGPRRPLMPRAGGESASHSTVHSRCIPGADNWNLLEFLPTRNRWEISRMRHVSPAGAPM